MVAGKCKPKPFPWAVDAVRPAEWLAAAEVTAVATTDAATAEAAIAVATEMVAVVVADCSHVVAAARAVRVVVHAAVQLQPRLVAADVATLRLTAVAWLVTVADAAPNTQR
jgi:hypothetical protein